MVTNIIVEKICQSEKLKRNSTEKRMNERREGEISSKYVNECLQLQIGLRTLF